VSEMARIGLVPLSLAEGAPGRPLPGVRKGWPASGIGWPKGAGSGGESAGAAIGADGATGSDGWTTAGAGWAAGRGVTLWANSTMMGAAIKVMAAKAL